MYVYQALTSIPSDSLFLQFVTWVTYTEHVKWKTVTALDVV